MAWRRLTDRCGRYLKYRSMKAIWIIAKESTASFSNRVPRRRHPFNQPMHCSNEERRGQLLLSNFTRPSFGCWSILRGMTARIACRRTRSESAGSCSLCRRPQP